MNGQSNRQPKVAGRRIQVRRRPGCHEPVPDTTVTDSWPPRLNLAL
jgi:hypothetical protein